MSANTQPIHPGSGVTNSITISTANTLINGTGTIGTLFTPAADGSLLERIKVTAAAATTAGMIRLFHSDDSGTTFRLFQELSVAAVTPSGTVKAAIAGAADALLTDDGWLVLNMPISSTERIGVSTNNAEEFEAVAVVGNY